MLGVKRVDERVIRLFRARLVGQEVLDLQKANRDLRRELDDLKKKLEARQAGGPAGTKSKGQPRKTE